MPMANMQAMQTKRALEAVPSFTLSAQVGQTSSSPTLTTTMGVLDRWKTYIFFETQKIRVKAFQC